MTLESDVAAIASRSLWLRARDLAGAAGSAIYSWPDYAGIRATPLNQSNAPTVTVSTDAPPLSSKSVRSNGAYGLVVGRLVQPVAATFASSSLSTAYGPDNAFNSASANEWVSNLTTTGHIGVQFPSAFVATQYYLHGRGSNQAPRAWTFEGSNDGSSWTVLDTRSAQNPASATTYTFSNSTAYAYYRLNVSAVQSGGVAVGVKSLVVLDAGGAPFTTIHDGTSGEVWAVVKSSALSSSFYKAGASVESFYPFSDGKIYDDFGSGIRPSFTPSASLSSWHIVRFQMDAGTKSVWIDGVLQNSVSGLTVAWPAAIGIGKGTTGDNANAANHYIAEIVAFNAKLSSGDATTVLDYLTAQHFTAASVSGSGSASAPAGQASGSGAVIVTGSGGATAPSAMSSGAGSATGAITTGAGASTAPAGVASGAGAVTVVGAGSASAPSGAASGSGTSDTPTPAGTLTAPVLTSAALLSWESQAAIPETDLLRAPVETGARLRSPLVLATAPDGAHDVERHAHLMPELTAAAPIRKGSLNFAGTDDYLYRVERATHGRPHVFVNGRDVTFTRGKGALVRDRSSSIPVGPVSASVQFPQFQPWDRTGEGDWAWCDLDSDPQVDIVWRHDDGTEEHVWEGFGASEGDGSPGLLVNCEGMFAQAQHAPHDPPVFMDERDIGHVIADALNGVKHRRWNKIPRVTTGITTSDRGRQGESVWQYVQDLLALAFTSSGRQWTLARVAPYTYRIQLKKAMSVVDWTVTYKAPGVGVNLTRDQSVRRDAIFGRGYAKDGGYWCGRVFPGLEFGVPPQYPMTNTSVVLTGFSDSDTDTGNGITVWQRKMRDLGYAIRVDGDMNSVDTEFVRQVQRARGILVDGVLGPQTWAATWENNSTDADTTSYRLPLASKTTVQEWLYSASGAKVSRNPGNDPTVIAHEMPEVDFGEGISKARAKVIAERMLDLEADPPWTGTITLDTDPWESGSSRFLIREGDNVDILGHPAGTVQVSEVSQSGNTVTLHVATRAMDRLTLAAIRERNVTARRDASSRSYTLNESSLNKASVVQYESESRAGTVPRTAVNGDVGLWTVRKTFVSQVGVAKVEFDATSPKAEIVVALFNRPIRTTVLASLSPDPLADSAGWYDNIETLQAKYGLMEVYGGPGNPGGYWPRQKDTGPLTGKLRESGALPYNSPYGGFVWVAMFTSRSCWVEGRVFPAVPT